MNDSPRSPQALLSAARRAKPDDATRSRIRAGLDGRLALMAAAGVGAGTAAGASAVAAEGAAVGGAVVAKASLFGFAAKVGLGVGLLVATGAGVQAWVASERASVTAPMAAAPSPIADETAEASAPAAEAPLAAAVESSEPEPTKVEASASAAEAVVGALPPASARGSTRRDAASIAAEVALLRKAQASLREGDGAASLKTIDALAARHPDGALREEREAARVLALCAAGRVDDARVEALRFLGRWPSSVQAPRVRASCAFAQKAALPKH